MTDKILTLKLKLQLHKNHPLWSMLCKNDTQPLPKYKYLFVSKIFDPSWVGWNSRKGWGKRSGWDSTYKDRLDEIIISFRERDW